MAKTKVTDLLNSQCLQQLYEGEQCGILMILGKKQISDKYIRLRVRDTKCQGSGCVTLRKFWMMYKLGTLGGLVSVCINTPNWRRALKPGKGLLVGKVDELNMENLGEATDLPDHITHPV